jgi:VWFA-related protein
MTRLLRYAGAVGLILLGTAPLTPQQTSEQSAGPVIRVTVDLVQVDAVVTDSQGRHVTGLKPEDFQILEDGKPQKITHFSYVPGTSIAGGPAPVNPPPREPSGKTPEAIPAPVKALRPEEVRRTIVLMADDLGLSSDDIPNVRKAMKSFVDRQMQAGDLASIMTTSGGMGAMQQLTSDKSQLYASIERIHYMPGRTGLTWYAPILPAGPDKKFRMEIEQRISAARSPVLTLGTLNVLAYAIQGLREMPGRKAIALFSDGFPPAAGRIVQLANRASIVIYTLDPRGLVSQFFTAVDAMGTMTLGNGIDNDEAKRLAAYRGTQKGLEQLAQGTGGIFFHDYNGLTQGLASALDDMSSYYLIGYQPQRTDFDQVRGLPKFHKIEVKVLRAGLQVRSRNGFVGVPDPPAVTEDTVRKSGKEELQKALFSPFHANGFPVHLSAFYSAAAVKDPKTGRRPALLRAMLAIDARGLKFSDTPDGKKQLNLDIIAVAYGANSEVVASSDRTFKPVMTTEEMNQTVASGLVYSFEIEIPKPGPYQLRVAAWDANAELAGSASTFVEIPDYTRSGIALSSVQLYDSDAKRNEELTRAGVLGAGSPVTRVFASGAALKYDCTVYGSLIDVQTRRPKLDMAVRLFRGPEQIYTGQPITVPIADGNSTAPIHAAGEVKLPATLPPGDYALELIVYDRLEKSKPQPAEQFVDFSLAKQP